MRIFVLAASLRQDSLNKKLARVAVQMLESQQIKSECLSLNDFAMPLYNQDIQDADGYPKSTLELAAKIEEANGFAVVSPEYNFSTPGVLKNAIDWLSRLKPQPFKGKPGLLLSASPSMVGGNRGLWHTRQSLECLGAMIYPNMFSLASAHEEINDKGELHHEGRRTRLSALLKDFADFTGRLAP